MRTRDLDAAVVVLNVASHPATIAIDLAGTAIERPQTPADLLTQQAGPKIELHGMWQVAVPANGWRLLGVRLRGQDT